MTHTITILGSTGSIGRQTLSVAEELGLRVAALTAEKNVDLLEAQCRKYRPELAVMTENAAAEELKTRLADMNIRVLAGSEALCEAAALPQAGETVPLGRRTKAGVWGIVLCVIALSFVTALNWTPINYTTIFGLQGRYWLPVLPLVLALVHHNRTFAVQKPAERKAVFAMLCLTSFVILQGAGLYATFQMPS